MNRVQTHDILEAEEVADMLRVSVRTITRMATRKEIAAFLVGKQWRFYRSDVEAYIAEQQRKQQEKK